MTVETKEISEHKLPGEGMHLVVGSDNEGDSSVRVRWCICPEIYEEIKQRKIEDAHVLLVVVNENTEMERRVVRLDQHMELISFHRPGLNKIMATLVYPCSGRDFKESKKQLLKKSSVDYYYHNVLYEGDFIDDCGWRYLELKSKGYAEVSVEVDERYFAKEPPELLKGFVNWGHETPLINTCHFRKRALFSIIFMKPLLFFLAYSILFLFRLIVCLALVLCGFRKVSFKPIFHLINMGVDDIERNMGSSVFIKNKSGDFRFEGLWVFMPSVLIGLGGLVYLLWYFFLSPDVGFEWFFIILALPICFWIFCCSFFWVVLNFSNIFGRKLSDEEIEKAKALKKLNEEKEEKKRAEKMDEDFSSLVCPGHPLEAELDDLPKERRTFHLRFHNFKVKVCRPFKR